MKSVKMISVLLLLVFLLLSVSSCSKNDFDCSKNDFEYVSSITITTAGETKTFKSYYTKSFYSSSSTAEEYSNADSEDRIYSYPDHTPLKSKKYLPPKSQMETGVTTYTHSDVYKESVKYLKYTDALHPKGIYVKVAFSGAIECYYVQVKVVDNSTVIIKDKNGETTYTVTSYSITALE